jgi:hypothetical protein
MSDDASVATQPEIVEKVTQALESPDYVWRTVEGLSKDTSLTEDTVLGALHHLPSSVLVTTTGKQGRLYTTREHYEKKQSFLGKFLSAVTGTLK